MRDGQNTETSGQTLFGSFGPTGLRDLLGRVSRDCAAGLSWAIFLRSLRELMRYGGTMPFTLLAVSISELFERFHYKLVAGVVNLAA